MSAAAMQCSLRGHEVFKGRKPCRSEQGRGRFPLYRHGCSNPRHKGRSTVLVVMMKLLSFLSFFLHKIISHSRQWPLASPANFP